MQTPSSDTPSTPFECVTFSSGDQVFCLEITQIREIRRWSPVTALPHAPGDVLGVMNLRGAVIPIIDLSARLGLGPTAQNDRNVVIVAQGKTNSSGLLVESVSEILAVGTDAIQETPDIKSELTRGYVGGVIALDDEMIRVLNLDNLLHTETGAAA